MSHTQELVDRIEAIGNITRIVTETAIARPVAQVFEFVTRPAGWPLWHPASLAVEGAEGRSLFPGESVVEHFRIMGRRGRIDWTVTARRTPSLWRIAGATPEGSAAITYHLTGLPGGTRFVRHLEYRVAGRIWRVADHLFGARLMARQSRQALQRLQALLESPDPLFSPGGA